MKEILEKEKDVFLISSTYAFGTEKIIGHTPWENYRETYAGEWVDACKYLDYLVANGHVFVADGYGLESDDDDIDENPPNKLLILVHVGDGNQDDDDCLQHYFIYHLEDEIWFAGGRQRQLTEQDRALYEAIRNAGVQALDYTFTRQAVEDASR
jgi:hypothetical protein